jgi:hypothetical protein
MGLASVWQRFAGSDPPVDCACLGAKCCCPTAGMVEIVCIKLNRNGEQYCLQDWSSARVAPRYSFYCVPIACRFPALRTVFRLSFRVRAWPLAESCVVLRAIQRFGEHPIGDIDFSYSFRLQRAPRTRRGTNSPVNGLRCRVAQVSVAKIFRQSQQPTNDEWPKP